MTDKERLEKVEMRLAVVKEQAYRKPKLLKEEKESIKVSIEKIVDELSDIIGDEELSKVTKERLTFNTRKELYNIKNVIESLGVLTEVAKSVVE